MKKFGTPKGEAPGIANGAGVLVVGVVLVLPLLFFFEDDDFLPDDFFEFGLVFFDPEPLFLPGFLLPPEPDDLPEPPLPEEPPP